MNIAGHLDRVTRDLPTQPTIIFDGRTICYAQLFRHNQNITPD
jgi:hypothetical protein